MNQNQKDFIRTLEESGLQPEIKYSTTTELFYVHSKLEIKQGSMLTCVCEHRNTPEEAVDAYRDGIRGKNLVADICGVRRQFLTI